MKYAFSDFSLNTAVRELHAKGQPISIEPKVFDLLIFLIENNGRVVTKDELIAQIWDGRFVSDAALSSAVRALRRALGDDGKQQRVIRTVHGRGFRFVAELNSSSTELLPEGASKPSEIRSVQSRPRRRALVGRDEECAELSKHLHPGALVSIVGPGGAGKTALALEVLGQTSDRFPGGAWFCELAPVQAKQVDSAVLGAIDSSAGAGQVTAAAIAERLGNEPSLLVLDNCEHVIDEAAELAQDLQELLPDLSLLTTSREALELRDETVFRLGGLGYADSTSMAVQLFYRCSERVAEIEQNPENDRIVREIVERLEGLPLAIELAVPRLSSNTPMELLEALDDQLSVLATRRRHGDARHGTMDDAIAWSFNLLGDAHKEALLALSIFSGAFTVQAAEAICSESNARVMLHDLVEQSMVAFVPGKTTSRFRLLEPIRQFARRQMEPQLLNDLAERHANWFAKRVNELALQMRGSDEIEACNALTAEWSDFGRALEWGRANQRDDIAVAPLVALNIHLLWQLRIEAFGWLEEGVKACELSPEAKGQADLIRAMGAWSAGDLDRSEALTESCIAAIGENHETKYLQFYQGFAREDFEKVFQCGMDAWTLAKEHGDPAWKITTTAFLVCGRAMHQGNPPEIAELLGDLEQQLSRHRWPTGDCCELLAKIVAAFGRGDPEALDGYRQNLAVVADKCHAPWFKVTAAGMEASNPSEAKGAWESLAMFTKNVEAAVSSGDVIQLPTILRSVVICLSDVGEFKQAARLSGLIPTIRGLGEKGSLAPGYDAAVQRARAKLSDAEFKRYFKQGQSLEISQAVDDLKALVYRPRS